MADNESIGGISIAISGDASQLNAAFSAAQASAAAAGKKVASAFNAGSASVDELATATVAAADAQAGFAASTETAATALGHQVTQIQAVSGTLRTLEGNQGIRAAERFLTLIPGLGAGLQYAFPVVGAIALFEVLSRLVGKSEELKAAEKELADFTQKSDEAFANMHGTLDRLNVEHIKNVFGEAAGTGAGATVMEQQAQRIRAQMNDLRDSINQVAYAEASSIKNYIPFHSDAASVDKIKAIGQRYKELSAILQEIEGKSGAARENQGRQAAEQAGSLAAKRIEDDDKASARAQEIFKQRSDAEIETAHATEQSRIELIDNEFERRLQTSAEQIRYEKAKEDSIASYAITTRDRTIQTIADKTRAESAGKSRPDRSALAQSAQSETEKAGQDYTLATDKAKQESAKALQQSAITDAAVQRELQQQILKSWEQGNDEKRKKSNETALAIMEAEEKELRIQEEVKEIHDKSAGDVKALQIKQEEIELESAYSQKILKTGSDRVAMLQQIKLLEAEATSLKIAGLEADKADANALGDQVKAANIQAQIDAAKQQGANQQATAQAGITAAQNQNNLGYQIGQEISTAITESLPRALGSTLANALFEHRKGDSTGKQVGEAMRDLGKQLTGEIFQSILKNLVEQLTAQLGMQALLGAIFLKPSVLGTTFAGGTDFAPGGTALIGEKGPEIMHVPRGAQIIPNHAIHKYADGTPGWNHASSGYHSTSFQTGTTNLHFHAHGINDPSRFTDHVMRTIPEALKRTSPGYSPYSH